jgi:transcription antitermination factor NusG
LLKEYPSQTKKPNNDEFKFGDLIKVTKGVYVGCQGRVSEVNNKEKTLTININFLGRLVPIKVLTADCTREKESKT